MRNKLFFCFLVCAALCQSCSYSGVKMSDDTLRDKIKGAWVGKLAGCTYALPVEFRYSSCVIPDEVEVPWSDRRYMEDLETGGNDDVYMNLTFIDVFDRLGLDAPVDSFAVAFANAPYNLWHANLQGRYNVLHGIMPPMSGHWKNNPHADDIDFQIEADYAGLMSPGMPCEAARFSDGIGHIMNYGDGWYGGVYVATMYSLAFIRNDIEEIVTESLQAIPEQSRYWKCINDMILQFKDNPDDWKIAWQICQDRYSEGYCCPGTVSRCYDIDAVLNSAYVVIGLLWGKGDFDTTMEIAMRCGQDSDCNAATAAGILGTVLGFNAIPDKWKAGLAETEDLEYAGTGRSLNEIYELTHKLACEVIKKNGGRAGCRNVRIPVQSPSPVRYERSFEGVAPARMMPFEALVAGEPVVIDFYGCGLLVVGGPVTAPESDYVAIIEARLDYNAPEIIEMPACEHLRRDELYFNLNMPQMAHKLELRCLNPSTDRPVNIWRHLTFLQDNAQGQE